MHEDFGPDAADPLFQANPTTIRTLLRDVHVRKLAIPDFQRDFVWDSENTRELLASVMSRYPAGTLLLLAVPPGQEFFRPREVEGAPELDGTKPQELILDGQQRVTALYQAMYGKGDHRYFVNFAKMRSDDGRVLDPEDIDFESAILVEPRDEGGRTRFDDRGVQIDRWYYPCDQYYVDNHLDDWIDDVVETHAATEDAKKALRGELRRIRSRYLTRLNSYAFPSVRLDEDTSLEAVCKIFETLNRQGVPLSVFELLTARFWPRNVSLRDLWEAALDQYLILNEFKVQPYQLLQAIALRARSSAQRSDVLKLDSTAVDEYWEQVVRGFAGSLELLRLECGVLAPKWLPYGMILVPMAAVWHLVENQKGPRRGEVRAKLQTYFWCSVFTGNFDQGANSQAGTDYNVLKHWLVDSKAPGPEAVDDFYLSTNQLLVSTTRRRALYAGFMALTVTNGAKDFHSSERLQSQDIIAQRIDAHHVFPRNWLKDNYRPLYIDRDDVPVVHSPELILNRALIDKETNQRIRARPPSAYLADIEEVRGEGALNEILDSHLLPTESGSGLFEDNYDDFLLARLELVADQIEAVTGRPVERTVDLRPRIGLVASD